MTKLAFLMAVAGSALLDAAAAAAGFRAATRGEGPRGLRGVAGAALAAGLAFGAKLPALAVGGLNTFGAICLAYVDLVLVGPLLALAALIAERRRGARRLSGAARSVAAAYALFGPAVGVYASFIEPARVRLERPVVAVPAARAGERPLRVGVLSDIQTDGVTAHERGALAGLMAEAPDLILIPGDLLHGFPEEYDPALPELRALLGTLRAPGGVFFVLGDCEDLALARALLDGTGIRILHNEIAEVDVLDRRVIIGGIERDFSSPAARRLIAELEGLPGGEDVRVLLSHRPDSVLGLPPGSRIDLVVAGHTHGGQVQLPLIGPLMTLSAVPREVAAGGVHEVGGNRIYVSRGLGLERGQAPPLRFLCPPEITLLTLRD